MLQEVEEISGANGAWASSRDIGWDLCLLWVWAEAYRGLWLLLPLFLIVCRHEFPGKWKLVASRDCEVVQNCESAAWQRWHSIRGL